MSTPICNCVDIDELADKVASVLEARRAAKVVYVTCDREAIGRAIRDALRLGRSSGGIA